MNSSNETKTTIIADIVTVNDGNILNAVIPSCFQIPATVKLKAKVEQLLKPVRITPNPIKYLF